MHRACTRGGERNVEVLALEVELLAGGSEGKTRVLGCNHSVERAEDRVPAE